MDAFGEIPAGVLTPDVFFHLKQSLAGGLEHFTLEIVHIHNL
jgi:hypothetical protein